MIESDTFKGIAQEVVNTMTQIVSFPLIVTNALGLVVSASSASLLGTPRKLCLALLEKPAQERKRAALQHNAEKIDGTGIAVPLFDACMEVVGSVEVLGEAGCVRPFALAIKRQIEMVLKERQRLQTAFLKENAIQDVISDFVNYVPGISDLGMLETRARCLGFAPDFLYVPIVFDIHHFKRFTREQWGKNSWESGGEAESFIQALKNRILMDIRGIFNHPNDVSISLKSDKYAIFCSISPQIRNDKEKVYQRVNDNSLLVLKKLTEKKLSAVIGIGFFFEGVPELSFSYRSAWEAVHLGKTLFRRPGVYDIQDLRFEYLLSSLPLDRQRRFVSDRLSQIELSPDDKDLRKTILAYVKNFFHHQSTADELHIHRNTLSYRLNRIRKLTGKSLQSFHEFLEMYVACLLADILSPDTTDAEKRQRAKMKVRCRRPSPPLTRDPEDPTSDPVHDIFPQTKRSINSSRSKGKRKMQISP